MSRRHAFQHMPTDWIRARQRFRMYYEVDGSTNPGQLPLVLLHGGGDTIETSFGYL
jgi:RNA:NAD 2'-phosphotransferase (TPT1/KptA family)